MPGSSSDQPRQVDVLILGGGITGAGLARDAAIRGYRVLLVDKGDFAGGTSHLTSKVVHGGLRYLDHGHIKPVLENLIERYRLLTRMAPNLVSPLKFVLPFEGNRLAKWLVTLCGLQLYGLPEWYRCGRSSLPMLGVRLRRDYPLMRPYPFAVTFWDARTNDARLVLATLRTAEANGAWIRNYTSVEEARRDDGWWHVVMRDAFTSHTTALRSRVIVNATGPWSPRTAELLGVRPMTLMGIKGSHLVLRRHARFGDHAIIMRSLRDLRPLWAIPWENSLIVGSTESKYEGEMGDIRTTADEVADLFDSFRSAFPGCGLTREDIRCAYAGVRPIVPQNVSSDNSLSREHRIDVDASKRLVTMMGGKLTTFRRMAEVAMNRVDELCHRPTLTPEVLRRLRSERLWPGLTAEEGRRLRTNLTRVYAQSGTPPPVAAHIVRRYGWDASLIFEVIANDPALGQPLADDLPYTLAELGYSCRNEKVRHLLDLVKRRTPLYFLCDHDRDDLFLRIADHVAPILGWGPDLMERELANLRDEFRADMAGVSQVDATIPHRPRKIVCA